MEKFKSATSIEPAYPELGSEQIIGSSTALQSSLAEVERLAPANATVLVLGETGTNRDLPIVFVVDHDVCIRESLEFLIRRKGWQPETFAFAREFLDRPRPLVPNCLVLDVSLQDLNGLDLQKRIAVERAETPIIFITAHGDVPTSVQAMKAGAVEFLMKPLSNEALLNAIREGLKRSSLSLGREAEMRSLRGRFASLSRRERQVMVLVVSGLLNKQAGAELGISEITVKAHRGQVMQKMGAESFADLVRMATRLRSGRAFLESGQFRPLSPSSITAESACTMTVLPSSGGAIPVAESSRSQPSLPTNSCAAS
jgi:FixJ family two-component response regulator